MFLIRWLQRQAKDQAAILKTANSKLVALVEAEVGAEQRAGGVAGRHRSGPGRATTARAPAPPAKVIPFSLPDFSPSCRLAFVASAIRTGALEPTHTAGFYIEV